MSESKKTDLCTMCQKYGLKPLTGPNILYYYTPIFGAVNYTTLSVSVMNPSLMSKMIPRSDVTNVLLCSSLVGSALYIYNRPHLEEAAQRMRLLYSGYNALMFNLGSVLAWAILKSALPKSNCIATIVGLVVTAGLLKAGTCCLDYADSRVQPPKK